ncbi:MAG TPA: SpoIIE family protein phosphatase [Chroococcidiopsis sp.]
MTQATVQKPRLMVVDDEADNLDLLYRTFRRDFEVFKAESALKALEMLEQEAEMSIIISDQRMPKMTGTEFLSIAAERFPDTMRILLTGYTDVEDLVGAINAGKVFKYITKPWNPDELRSVVFQAADTYRVLKQRTEELNRALRRESLLNAVMTAIRESLDYGNMLQTIVETIGQAFAADRCLLRPVDGVEQSGDRLISFTDEAFSYVVCPKSLAPGEEVRAIAPVALDGAGDGWVSDSVGSDSFKVDLAAIAELRQIDQTFVEYNGEKAAQLTVPLVYQQNLLAVMTLHFDRSSQPWSSEDLQLLEGVAEQTALAISQAKLYQRIQQQTEQMRAELSVARQIQSNLLRQTLPALDHVKIQACCHPAREVGGDFFEVYQHPQGDLWLAVGDVSGKGVPAALFMASAISVLRRELAQEISPEPDVIMRNLNSILSDDLVGSNCFITMVLARYTPETGTLVYANAGHVYPLVWSRHTGGDRPCEPHYLKVRGVPLGILPIWKATAGTLPLSSGEVLLLTSDGITEASVPSAALGTSLAQGTSPDTAMLKQDGLWQLIMHQNGSLNLSAILTHIQAHNQVQEDDQTLLSLEVL